MAAFPKAAVHPAYTRIFQALAMVLFALLVSGRVAYAQATTSVRGTVTDPSGSAVVGANVVLANAESKTERTATTGTQGEYQFLFLSPGMYALKVTAMSRRVCNCS
jgi:protocatechuate 3,4-dioxygenase beta subunit